MQWQTGTVQWFCKSSGEGVVVSEQGESYYVHYSTIVAPSSRTKTTAKKTTRKVLEAGARVKFSLYENLYSKRVEKIQEV